MVSKRYMRSFLFILLFISALNLHADSTDSTESTKKAVSLGDKIHVFKNKFYNYTGEELNNGPYDLIDILEEAIYTILTVPSIIINRCTGLKLIPLSIFLKDFDIDKIFCVNKLKLDSFEPKDSVCKVFWIGHSSLLINIGKRNILIDPVFEDTFFGVLKRIFPPGIERKNLPKIDLVLISHNHRDHLERSTIKYLSKQDKQPVALVPAGLSKFFIDNGFKKDRVIECLWGDIYENNRLKVTFLPAYHCSGRGISDFNKTAWGSWMIEYNKCLRHECLRHDSNFKLYFGGDSGYADHFSSIGQEFDNIDIAFLPVSPVSPKDLIRKQFHMTSKEVAMAFKDLGAKMLIPIHWGTFILGEDSRIDKSVKKIESLLPEGLKILTLGKAEEFVI